MERTMPRSPVRVAVALAALAVGLAPALPPALARPAEGGAPAAPDVPPEVQYKEKLRAGMVIAGQKFEAAGSFAYSNRLKRSGREAFKKALEFDPDNARARRELGFDKKGAEWVAVPAKVEKLAELRDESESKRGEYEKRLAEAAKAAAQALVTVGTVAKDFGMEAEANEMWKRVLDLDYQEPTANRAVGNTFKDGKWMTAQKLAHLEYRQTYDKALSAARTLEVPVRAAEKPTGFGTAAGIDLKCLRSDNFQVESNYPEQDIREILTWSERARRFYCDLFEVPDRLVDYKGDPAIVVIVKNDAELHRLIDACNAIEADKKNFYKGRFGSIAVNQKLTLSRYGDADSAKVHVVHGRVHSLSQDSLGDFQPWLRDALASSVAAALRDADLSVCFAEQGSTGGIEMAHLALKEAPELLVTKIRGKTDTPLGGIVKLPSTGLTPADLAKSWSVLMFLLERDRLQCREWLAAASGGNLGENSKDARVLARYFKEFTSWEALDAAWRSWAVDVYRTK
jgi:hypothetical protein